MGLRYSFNLVFPVAATERAIEVLAGQLCASDRERLLGARPWRPTSDRLHEWCGGNVRERSGFSSLARTASEFGDDRCFSPLLRIDQTILAYEGERQMQLPREGEFARFGCMWTSFSAGDALFVISSTAATSDMSRLCERSASAQAPWRQAAETAPAIALFLDTEDDSRWTLVHPRRSVVARPDDEPFELPDDDHRPTTDAFWRDALAKAGVHWQG